MLISAYSVANDGTLTKKLVLNEVVSYHYKRWFYKVGSFELVVLDTDPGLPYKVYPGDILYVYDDENGDDSLYVTTVEAAKGRIKFSGYDLKIILNFRISLFPTEELEAGTYGYDVRQGYTGDIIKGYIDYNLCEAEDPNRQIPNCYCTTDSALGISNDTYMSRLQPLNEVVEALCENAGIGYKVTLDTYTNYIIINIFGGSDKHTGIGFGSYIGNADSVRKIRDNTSERSVAWAVNGTSAADSTVTAVELNDSSGTGLLRKETIVTINCETDFVSVYAKHSAGECKETDEIDASVNAEGMIYDVGDYVIVYDDIGGYNEMRINAIEKDYKGVKLRKKLHFVDYQVPAQKEKSLEKLASASAATQKDVIDQKLDGGGSGIEHAVIIQEKDISHLLHEYSVVDYIAGNRIVYAGTQNQIIGQGYIILSTGTIATGDSTSKPSLTYYSDIVFEKPVFLAYSSYKYSIVRIYLRFKEATTYSNTFELVYVTTDGTELVGRTVTAYSTYEESFAALAIGWSNIYPPGYVTSVGEFECEFGCAHCNIFSVYTINNATSPYTTAGVGNAIYYPYIQFASEAEYNAAVGLTYEPLTLQQVNETVTEV